MRVTNHIEIDRLSGQWWLTIHGSNEETGSYTETMVPCKDIVEAIRQYAPELLKEDA